MRTSLVTLALAACATPEPPRGHAPPIGDVPATVGAVEPSEWLVAHLKSPVAPQGTPPEDWSTLEQSLEPAACGACHPQQLADWSDTWHAKGMGPGVIGQYLDWDGTNDAMVAKCNRCHAPLSEQHMRIENDDGDDWIDNPAFVPGMREQGLTCAGCHVRQHQRFGPPPRTAQTIDGPVGPHDGFTVRDDFRDPAFCRSCHDFTAKPASEALEGKKLQETTEEWRRTTHAAEGQTCQTCHMPDGRHTWKGIHTPELVRDAVEVTATLTDAGTFFTPVQASITLTNVGAAHRMPTYTTPEIKLFIEQIDESGAPIEGTRQEGSVARRITPNLKKELWDTRLLPGESYALPYRHRRVSGATALVTRIEVWPDEAYRRFYEIKLRAPEKIPKGADALRQAMQTATESRYTLWEQTIPLPE